MCIQYAGSFAELQRADKIRKTSGFREYSHLNNKIIFFPVGFNLTLILQTVSEEEHLFFSSACLQNIISTNTTIL